MDEALKSSPPITARDIAHIFRRRRLIALATFVVVVASTLALTSRMKPVYKATTRVLVDDPGRSALPSSIAELISSNRGSSLDSQFALLRSRRVLTQVVKEAGLASKSSPAELGGRLELGVAPGGILDVGVRADTGKEAAKTANLLAKKFIQVVREREDRAAFQATNRLRNTLKETQKQKTAAQNAVNNFMKGVGNVNPIALFENRATQTIQLQQSLDNARKELQVQQRRRERLAADKERLGRTAPTIVTGTSYNKSGIIDAWRDELHGLERKRKLLLENFTPEAEEVQEVDAEIQAVKQGLKEAEKNAYSIGSKGVARNPDYAAAVSGVINTDLALATLQKSIRVDEALLDKRKAEQRVLADRKSNYEDLQRRLSSTVGKYEQLRQGITEIDVRRSTAVPSIEVLDWAQVPLVPSSPNRPLNTAMALFLGAFAAVASALLSEYFAATRHGSPGVGLPHVAGVPLLGSVPMALPAPDGNGLPVPVQASLRAEDALREVGYCLAHLRHVHPPVHPAAGAVPVVLLVGTRTDDTTAAIAAQLAATLVRDGLRVTLIDADRAHPRLNRVFGAPDAPGLADVLGGRARARDILHVGVDGNLRFLAAGSPHQDAPGTEAGLRALFKELGTDTDLVLVSGPSAFQVPAVASLQKAADGVVLVATPGVPAGESVARARRLLTNGYQPAIFGVVLSEAPDLPVVWANGAPEPPRQQAYPTESGKAKA